MEEKLQLIIMPSFDSVRESLHYEEHDDYNTNAILYKMGYDEEPIDIEDDEIFKIRKGFIGRINSKENYYLLTNKKDIKDKEDFLIRKGLSEGRYKFSSEDHVIYRLE